MIDATINDRYEIENELGRGGMGIVYRARDQVLQRDVAIKVMSSSDLGTEGQARLLQEARAAAGLNHPNVVAVHDVGQTALPGKATTSSYIVMELVEGELLRDYKLQSIEEAIEIGRQICAALEEAHQKGIIHRDLKPENVILTQSQIIKLMDFGLARSAGATRLTQEGALVGTLSYIAPEVILGKPATAASDLYALGVILYELAAGRPPFEGVSLTAVISQHLHAPVVPPSAFYEHVPSALDELIVQLLAKQPDDRPDSAAQVGQTLASIRLDESEAATSELQDLSTLNRLVRGRLIGREKELKQATELWQLASSGRCQVLLISGEPGIGKTRLARELTAYAEINGGRVLAAECYAEAAVPYMPVAQIVRTVIGNGLEGELPDNVLADLLTLAPELRALYPGAPEPRPLDPQSEQSRLFESAVTLCQSITSETPLLLFLDDLHWADSGSLSMIRHLTRRLKNQPVMVAATYREIDIDDSRPFRDMMLDLSREQLTVRIKLSRLDQEGTKALLATLFSEEITPEFLDGIYLETEGNPFFVEEVCKALIESGELYFEDGRWHRPRMDELDIPQGIRDVIQSRINKLPAEVQEALCLAAILGREFDFDTLVEASDHDENQLIDALEIAEEAQLIEEVSARVGVVFAFVHALIPTALVESIRTLRRRRLHRRAAQAIESLRPEDYEALAYHFSEVGAEEEALKYYHLAGDRAAAAYANNEAEAHYLSALDIVQDQELRLELLTKLGSSVSYQSRYEEAINTWNEAINIATSMGWMDWAADLYGRCSRAAWDGGDTPRGLAIGKKGLAAAHGAPSSKGYAHLLHETARAYLFNGLTEEAEVLCREALQVAEESGALGVKVEALTTLSILPSFSADETISMLEEAALLAESSGLVREAERARYNLGVQYFWQKGNYREADIHINWAAKIAHERGDLSYELFFSVPPIVSEIKRGNLTSAEQMVERVTELAESATEPGSGRLGLKWAKGMLMAAYGDIDMAVRILFEMVDGAREQSDFQILQMGINALGEILVGDKRYDDAVEILEESIALGSGGFIPGDVKPHCLMALIFLSKGNIELARNHFQQAVRKAEDRNNVYVDIEGLPWAKAHLAASEGEWTKAWSAFEEAMEIVTISESYWIRAKRQLEWAEFIMQQGLLTDRVKARKLLQEAQMAFDGMGAKVYTERAVKLLAAYQPS